MKTQTKASSDGGGGGEVKSLSFLNVSACSYEGSLFGFSITENREEIGLELDMSYGFHASRGSLKALSCSSSCRYLVSGGMDERIRIFDMHNHCAVGELTNHTGAVTCLQFYRDAYLFSGSEVRYTSIANFISLACDSSESNVPLHRTAIYAYGGSTTGSACTS